MEYLCLVSVPFTMVCLCLESVLVYNGVAVPVYNDVSVYVSNICVCLQWCVCVCLQWKTWKSYYQFLKISIDAIAIKVPLS